MNGITQVGLLKQSNNLVLSTIQGGCSVIEIVMQGKRLIYLPYSTPPHKPTPPLPRIKWTLGGQVEERIPFEDISTFNPVARILVPDWGDRFDSGIGLSYRPARLHRLTGRYDNPIPASTLYPPFRDYEFGYSCVGPRLCACPIQLFLNPLITYLWNMSRQSLVRLVFPNVTSSFESIAL